MKSAKLITVPFTKRELSLVIKHLPQTRINTTPKQQEELWQIADRLRDYRDGIDKAEEIEEGAVRG